MGDSRPSMILYLLFFYSFLLVIYSAYGVSITEFKDSDVTLTTDNDLDTSVFDTDQNQIGLVKYFKGLIIGFNETPLWLNILFFIPISSFFIYLIIVAWINPGG